MIPILYDSYETAFTSQGVGMLTDCISCTVKEVLNGEFELEMQYPMSGELFSYMVNYGGIVCAEHDHNGDLQPFEIYRYSAPIDGIVTFNAHHISYRLSNVIIGDRPPVSMSGQTPGEVFEKIEQNAFTPCQFNFVDLTGYYPNGTVFSCKGRASVRDAFLNGNRADDEVNGTQALVNVFPGELVWDKFEVRYYRRRGAVRGFQIRYGKNLTEVTREHDTSSIVSAVFPVWYGTVDDAPVTVNGPQVNSPKAEIQLTPWTNARNGNQMETPDGDFYYFGAANVRAAVVDFSDQFQEKPTQAQLRQAALDWMSKNSSWRAYDNITVRFVDLYNASGYENIKDVEQCQLGDYVDIIYTDLGIVSANVEIVSATYDVLSDSFIEMELGEIRTTFAQVLIDTIKGGTT